jgi:hypothetical protein
MKELLEKDFNYFQWEGILKGQREEQNKTFRACFEDGLSIKRIARIFKVTPQEVVLRMKEPPLLYPSRPREAAAVCN